MHVLLFPDLSNFNTLYCQWILEIIYLGASSFNEKYSNSLLHQRLSILELLTRMRTQGRTRKLQWFPLVQLFIKMIPVHELDENSEHI